MNAPRTKRESMSVEYATVSNMWEIAAIVEVLERLGRIIEMGQRLVTITTLVPGLGTLICTKKLQEK